MVKKVFQRPRNRRKQTECQDRPWKLPTRHKKPKKEFKKESHYFHLRRYSLFTRTPSTKG